MFSATSASDYALKHPKISPWRGRPVHPHAASKNKSLGRILLQFIEKGFEDCNIIFRQCARDLGGKHFVTERCLGRTKQRRQYKQQTDARTLPRGARYPPNLPPN